MLSEIHKECDGGRGIGYKILRMENGKLITPFMGTFVTMNEWLTAHIEITRSFQKPSIEYPTGWHLFQNYEAALFFVKEMFAPHQIFKAEFDELTYEGSENFEYCNNKPTIKLPCFVARKMKIVEQCGFTLEKT
jgi:hypothetical protein